MKIVQLLRITAIMLVAQGGHRKVNAQGGFTCPPGEAGFFPADDTCGPDYYYCFDDGAAFLQTCPSPDVFDPVLGGCILFEDASCNPNNQSPTSSSSPTATDPATSPTAPGTSTSPISTTTVATPSTSTPGLFVCPQPDGFFAIPDYCGSDFIICVDGDPYLSVCPGGNIFDPETLKCELPTAASCTPVNPPFKCPNPDGFFPISPGLCNNTFYVCNSGSYYLDNCPGTSLFDPILLVCVASGSCVSATTTTTPTPFVCPGDGEFPYPGNCNLYYICFDGNHIVASCNNGQVFNPSLQFCDDPINVPDC